MAETAQTLALPTGTVVRSLAGRDAGYLLCVVGGQGESLLLCDGRERPLERPKRKNAKHIRPVEGVAPFGSEALRGNKALHKGLLRLERQLKAAQSDATEKG
ncbi:MAG: KOW domain-containing RNA-binding protein [Oscillospiraceae bacterium]|jgi:ribosomal protein L14E/L6E/L27E|nr:KOW domain-containing RNA-binding protein [Oscillospiraceae bacterium]